MNNNNELQDFLSFVENDSNKSGEQNQLIQKELKEFFKVVPELLQPYVKKIINERFEGNVNAYKPTVPLFLSKFTVADKDVCDKVIVTDKKNSRKQSKKRKHSILWACQLLKLVGRKASDIVPYAVVNEYLQGLREQEEFCRKHKVISATGSMVCLTPPEKRKEQRNAQNYKIAKFMEQLAYERMFTFAFITLTLPPEYHPNPKEGKYSYNGATPAECAEKLQMFWELLRALLEKHKLKSGEDFFGMQVNEGHKDSCLHKHALVYIRRDNLPVLKNIMDGITYRERVRISNETGRPLNKVNFKWDFKENNGKASGSTYLFKYISPDLNNKAAVKNEALRSFYGVRSFAFFGLQNKISTFNFICNNWKKYEGVIKDMEVIDMLKNKDLYAFYTKHSNKFENCHIGEKKEKKFIGVSYFPSDDKEILLQKSQFVIVENENKSDCSGIAMHNFINEDDVNLFNRNVWNAKQAFPLAQKKQMAYDGLLLEYFTNQDKNNIDNYIPQLGCFFSETSPEVIKQYFTEELETNMEIFENTFEDTYLMEFNGYDRENETGLNTSYENSLVILKHHYSSKTPSGFVENRQTPILTPEFS